LEKVYDHLKKFGQSLGTPPQKVRITQTTQTNTNFFIGLVEFGRILPPNESGTFILSYLREKRFQRKLLCSTLVAKVDLLKLS